MGPLLQRKKKKNNASMPIIGVLLALAVTALFLFLMNDWVIDLQLNGDENVSLEYPDSYTEEGATAVVTGTYFPFIEQEVPVVIHSEVDTSALGTYEVTYTATKWGTTATVVRTVTVQDTTKPVITLDTTGSTVSGNYKTGYSAWDNYDGDLTDQVVVTEENGTVTYSVTDSSGNRAEVTRRLASADTTPPVIKLDNDTVTILQGTEWDGGTAAAIDETSGNITSRIRTSGTVDTNTPGIYQITYMATDDAGNTGTAVRTVIVRATQIDEADGTVYLTFDGGPGAYTETILDTLSSHNAKATFFVTDQNTDYESLIAREASDGHSVGVYSYSGDTASIYTDTSSFWTDFDKMQDVIEAQTGSRTLLMRFPGGSNNTYGTDGIMDTLTTEAVQRGFVYFDWNVVAGDGASDTADADTIAQNIITGIQNQSVSVVLCHDTNEATASALEQVLTWGESNGYTFAALEAGSTTARFS